MFLVVCSKKLAPSLDSYRGKCSQLIDRIGNKEVCPWMQGGGAGNRLYAGSYTTPQLFNLKGQARGILRKGIHLQQRPIKIITIKFPFNLNLL